MGPVIKGKSLGTPLTIAESSQSNCQTRYENEFQQQINYLLAEAVYYYMKYEFLNFLLLQQERTASHI